jgi:succinylglutamate desuccinylase
LCGKGIAVAYFKGIYMQALWKITETALFEKKYSSLKENNICEIGEHIIGDITSAEDGPTLIVIGGIHGNEPAGVLASKRILSHLSIFKSKLKGRVIFLAGNTRALQKNVRYIDADLNRHWTSENVHSNKPDGRHDGYLNEDLEQRELLKIIQDVLKTAKDEVYVLDLHTTSAHGVPFVTLGDTLRNRAFAMNFPVTIVLGIEEQLSGTMLEYLNNLGVVTLGFEAGQHQAIQTIENHEALIWIALVASGCLREESVPPLNRYKKTLQYASGGMRFVEVRYRHALKPTDNFKMHSGYKNFQPVKRGEILASDKTGQIKAKETSLILMPLYQPQGDDGFFLVRHVKSFWLKVSEILRRIDIGAYMHILPGVKKHPKEENSLVINTNVARLFPLQIFHLLGFRRRRWIENRLVVSRRLHDRLSPFRR